MFIAIARRLNRMGGSAKTAGIMPCIVAAIGVFLASFAPALGQVICGGWVPGSAYPGLNGPVYALGEWDPDGAGPLPSRVVVGGAFTVAANTPVANIAMWDPATSTWSSLGAGTNAEVRALAVLRDGSLVAGGSFSQAGEVAASGVARWNGSTWSPLGSGTNGAVWALAVLDNGDLVAGGSFSSAGGIIAGNIAR